MLDKYTHMKTVMEELNKVHKLAHQYTDKQFVEITPEQGRLLFMIHECNMNQKQIALKLHITEATLSVRINRLVDAGYVKRVVDSTDKRNKKIVLSDKGEDMLKEIEETFDHLYQVMCHGLTYDDYQKILDTLHKIQNNLKEEIK